MRNSIDIHIEGTSAHHAALELFQLFERLSGGAANSFAQRLTILEGQMENVMADIDTLTAGLQAISADVDAALQHTAELETQLQELQSSTPDTVDLQPALDLVASIRGRLEGASSTASDSGATTSGDATVPPQEGSAEVGPGTSPDPNAPSGDSSDQPLPTEEPAPPSDAAIDEGAVDGTVAADEASSESSSADTSSNDTGSGEETPPAA